MSSEVGPKGITDSVDWDTRSELLKLSHVFFADTPYVPSFWGDDLMSNFL